jgi:hypothetical protein
MPDWSIRIVPGVHAEDLAIFAVDRNDVKPGAPLVADPNDLVSWNNTTDQTHQPWPANADGTPILPASSVPRNAPNYLSDPIPQNSSSRPSWLVPTPAKGASNTFRYCCLLHPREQGHIIISSS